MTIPSNPTYLFILCFSFVFLGHTGHTEGTIYTIHDPYSLLTLLSLLYISFLFIFIISQDLLLPNHILFMCFKICREISVAWLWDAVDLASAASRKLCVLWKIVDSSGLHSPP